MTTGGGNNTGGNSAGRPSIGQEHLSAASPLADLSGVSSIDKGAGNDSSLLSPATAADGVSHRPYEPEQLAAKGTEREQAAYSTYTEQQLSQAAVDRARTNRDAEFAALSYDPRPSSPAGSS